MQLYYFIKNPIFSYSLGKKKIHCDIFVFNKLLFLLGCRTTDFRCEGSLKNKNTKKVYSIILYAPV